MFEFSASRRLPVPGVDRIASAATALSVVVAAMSAEPRHETIVVLLDDDRRGGTVIVITGTEQPDALLGVVDMIAEIAIGDPDAAGIVVASVRPGQGIVDGDAERWAEADEICRDADLDLVEWFVLGTSIHCPRELRGEAPRWA